MKLKNNKNDTASNPPPLKYEKYSPPYILTTGATDMKLFLVKGSEKGSSKSLWKTKFIWN